MSAPGGTTAGAGRVSVAGASAGGANAPAGTTAGAGQTATGGKSSAGTGGTTAGGSTAIIPTGGTSANGGTTVVVAGKTASGGVGTGGTAKGGDSRTGGVGGTGGTTTSGGATVSGGTASGGTTDSGGATTASGGTASGGTTGAGGATTASGATTVSGGTTALGGTTASGGTTGSGGTQSSSSSQGQCPAASDYVGDPAWPHSLVVTGDAQYCGTFDEQRTLEQEYAAKAKLTIAQGTYPVPGVAGTYAFALPVCFERKPGSKAPAFNGAGKDTLGRVGSSYHHSFNQPLSLPGETWSFQGNIYYPDATPLVLDGSPKDPFSSRGYWFWLCNGADCYQLDDVVFAACNPTTFRLNRHTVTFDGGQVVLDLRLGDTPSSTQPGAFVAASGTLDGVAFSQTDYWKLVYSPTHHHYTRTFAALFDAPIGSACGLKVLGVAPFDETLPQVSTINCDLSDIAARTVISCVTTYP